MIDAHAHVHDEAFDVDREAMLRRAQEAGITALIAVGTDVLESRRAVACTESAPFVWASVGLHPHIFNTEADEKALFDSLGQLRALAESSVRVVAIGECGLDYFSHDSHSVITSSQKAWQKEGLRAQMDLADELSLPLILHTRPTLDQMDAYEDMYMLLESRLAALPLVSDTHPKMILHCYMGDAQVTERFLTLPGVWFSFTGNITYKPRAGLDVAKVLRMIPVERLLVETDCPYLAPLPYRGRRNEPAYVARVAEHIAETKGIAFAALERELHHNLVHIFPRLSNI
jgi:TatD DNase family protein